MKKAIILIFGLLLLTSCNEKKEEKIRYTQSSDEINTMKSVIRDYETSEWSKYKNHFADSATLYYNSNEAIDVDAAVTSHQESLAALSSYEFVDEDDEFEMVVTDDEETWVNYWGNWQGTIAENDSIVNIPVHITARFSEGKIVSEHVYYNNSGMSQALSRLEEARMQDQDSLNME